MSDHPPIYVVHEKARDTRPKAQFQGRTYRDFNPEKFKEHLLGVDWSRLHRSTNVETAWEIMFKHITSILGRMCPIKTFHIKNYRPDWMTGGLKLRTGIIFTGRLKKTGDGDLWNIAKHLRNVTNYNIRIVKKEFVLSELKKNENNPKKFWKVIHTVIPTGKSDSKGEIVLRNGTEKINRTEVPSFINDYFVNVGNLTHPLDSYGNDLEISDDDGETAQADRRSLIEVREIESSK